MLLWESLFLNITILTIWSLAFSSKHIFVVFIHGEFLLMVLFLLLLSSAVFFNINNLLALAYFVLILSGLELALGVLILTL